MWELSNKLHRLRSELRKEHISSLMSKSRREEQRSQEEEELQSLVELPVEQLCEERLKRLVALASKDHDLALAHLGNLAIDRYLTAQKISSLELLLGNSERWTWVVNAFAEIGYCTPVMFNYCVRRIITKRSNASLENALEVLDKAMKLDKACMQCFRQSQLVLALINHGFDSNQRISQLVLTLLTAASSEDEDMPRRMVEWVGQSRVVRLLQHALLKIQSVHRALAVQIANNFLLSGFPLPTLRSRLLELAVSEKERVKVEISYYLKALAEKAPEETILSLIRTHALMATLQSYISIRSSNPKYDNQIAKNATQAHALILQRFSEEQPLKKETQGDKMVDESDNQTVYEEDSSLMAE